MTINFLFQLDPESTRLVTRYWYHVPRVGDVIGIDGLEGVVYRVSWHDDLVLVSCT